MAPHLPRLPCEGLGEYEEQEDPSTCTHGHHIECDAAVEVIGMHTHTKCLSCTLISMGRDDDAALVPFKTLSVAGPFTLAAKAKVSSGAGE